MTSLDATIPYSFSMVNLVKLMPEWNWPQFHEVMRLAKTNNVELIPGMILGSEWDQYITQPSEGSEALALLMSSYSVTSIQSLTYGLNINLADRLNTSDHVLRRFESLAHLGELLKCRIFVLGSPGQKTLSTLCKTPEEAKNQFIDNCAWMASILTPNGILSLEHNTLVQGAEYCNTLGDVVNIVTTLRKDGVSNIGLNLDTKCLLHEYADDLDINELIDNFELGSVVSSIQVSLDFLTRSRNKSSKDTEKLMQFANHNNIRVSLEEFGLLEEQLASFLSAWQLALYGITN